MHLQNIDTVIIREQTEGEYSALEHESVEGVVECLKIVTAKKSMRIAKFAFDYATKNNRKKVTCVHKANIMKLGDGLFLRSCEEVSAENTWWPTRVIQIDLFQISKLYPRIKFEKMIVDNTTMQLVSNPHQVNVKTQPICSENNFSVLFFVVCLVWCHGGTKPVRKHYR